jgi:hypothetical protein
MPSVPLGCSSVDNSCAFAIFAIAKEAVAIRDRSLFIFLDFFVFEIFWEKYWTHSDPPEATAQIAV